MRFNPEVFRLNDIRGRADTVRGVGEVDLTDEFVTALGQAFATVVRRESGVERPKVALGMDCRLSGARLMAAFEAGVRAAGADVLQLGVVGTPIVYFALHHFAVHGGVVITGSHNPAHWNGFKLCLGTAAMHGAQIEELAQIMDTGDVTTGAGAREDADGVTPYHDWVVKDGRVGPRKPKVVVDAGNGTGGVIAVPLYRALGYEVIELYCEPDGRFPNHHPDPTIEANLVDLKAAMVEHGADLGVAFDGDSDRIGAVDHTGRVVWGDQLLLFFGRALLKAHPGATIVSEVKCSRVLYDGLREAGGVGEMWKVGHSLIKARMKALGALLGGEMSGHLFFNDRFFGFDDAIYAGARLLELLSHSEQRLADMVDALPHTVTTPELRVACADADKFEVMARASAHFKALYPVFDLDGARITFPAGWGLIRPSNTQPVLVMRFEADTAEHLASYRGEVEAWLRTSAPEVDLDASTDH